MRERGAVAWKVMLAVATGVGGIWAATQLPFDAPALEPARQSPAARLSAGATSSPVQPAAAPSAPPAPARGDPFAGVDLSNESVLRHIAGIEDKPRTRATAANRAAARSGDGAAPAGAADGAIARDAGTGGTAAGATGAAVSAVPASEPIGTAAQEAVRPTVAPVQAAPATHAPPAAEIAADERAIAAARTEPGPPAVAPPLRILDRTLPEFPVDATRAGIASGRVVARLTIDAEGRVRGTDILSATPAGYFERVSRRALSTWRYAPTGRETTTEVELVFTRD